MFTGLPPFPSCTDNQQVLAAITSGVIPEKPKDGYMIYEDLWTLCCRSWEQEPKSRPNMNDVVEAVRFVSHSFLEYLFIRSIQLDDLLLKRSKGELELSTNVVKTS